MEIEVHGPELHECRNHGIPLGGGRGAYAIPDVPAGPSSEEAEMRRLRHEASCHTTGISCPASRGIEALEVGPFVPLANRRPHFGNAFDQMERSPFWP